MNAREAPGKEGIPAEICKAACSAVKEAFHSVVTSIWEDKDMPQELRGASIVSLVNCRNYRGISLLSIGGKIIAQIALKRLITSISEANILESQCEFRPGQSTIDWYLPSDKSRKNASNRNVLVCCQRPLTPSTEHGCPRKLVQIIHLFHDNMTG